MKSRILAACLTGTALLAAVPVTAEPLLLRNVGVLDLNAEQPEIAANRSILIDGGQIVAIGVADEIQAPDHAVVVEGEGRVVMPGLYDMHVHIWDEAELAANLAHGVTTVRNASGMPFHLRLAKRVAAGELAGPRIVTTGPILNSHGPNGQIIHQYVDTEAEAREAVRAQHEAGFRRIKVYSNLTPEAWRGIKAEADTLGMTIMGHTPEGRRAEGMPYEKPFNIPFEDLLDQGFVTIEHTESIVWHGLRDSRDSDAAKALAADIADASVAVDPTLVAFYNLLRTAETKGAYVSRPGTQWLNPMLVAQEQPNYDRWANEAVAPARKAFEFYKLMTKAMADAGVTLVAGSDAGIHANPAGLSLLDELNLLEEAGLTRVEVLKTATVNAASVLKEGETHACLAVGCAADLLVLDADPTKGLATLSDPALVIAQGKVHDRQAIEALKLMAAKADVSRTQANVIEGLQAQGTDVTPLLKESGG
ncbi:amidohydrolase family protein [Croceicoccus sediminis]|uniref:amidohydrolase family protein n=1 Tax=Croceicoccus sediminis TaxID=2571150 RepID=UPI0014788C01|nr:amidohydrolase family protein [Croceicoccus sediminis]